MSDWNEKRSPFEDRTWYAQPIQPNLADISACVPPALKKGHHILFQFWGIWLLQRSIKQFLLVKCLLLFFNLNTAWQHWWMILFFKQKLSLYKENASFVLIFVEWNWKISIKLDISRGNCSKWAWPPILSQKRTFLK